jgi:hypothetical protein
MSCGEVLFQGTWHDAVVHADHIPEAMRVRIVEAEWTREAVPRDEFQAIVDELILEARKANASGEEDDPEMTPDAYTLILREKLRR